MNFPILRSLAGFLSGMLLAQSLSAASPAAAAAPFVGRWALDLPNGAAGWMEVADRGGWLDGSILWGGGSVLPAAHVHVADGALTLTRVRDVERKDASGKVLRRQQLTETVTARIEGDVIRGTRVVPRAGGDGADRAAFTGRRIPPLPTRPDLSRVRFGEPVALLNGRDLSGWRAKESNLRSAWSVQEGVLVNRPPPHAPGTPAVRTANLRTEREFEDFNLKLEVNVPKGSNSGVYLRGIYEIQVHDSHGKPLDSHHMGAVYSRITPAVSAEKPAGEWQSLDLTLVDRHVTVVLNGRVIIDNQPLLGCTGGAMWSDESRPGPIYLQGDHGGIAYRNFVLRPVVK